jgi:glycosyltransferase involved in cell wall biosynthesis
VLCYFESEESIVLEFKKAGINVRLLKLNRNSGFLQFVLRLRKEISSVSPDVVHVQYMAPGALPIIAARLAGVKTVFATVHQPWTTSHGRFSKLIMRMASLLCTGFMAVSVNAEKSWFGNGRLFNENIPLKLQPYHFTIYNSVDTERIKTIASSVNHELLKQKLLIPDGIPVIGVVSRLRSEKGIDILIDAFKQLVKGGAIARLLIVGTGPDDSKLRAQASDNELNNSVTFYGEADWERAMQLIAIMDMVVVPSRFEGFGLTAAEAMAAGKPVVASDVFGLKEVVIHNETGFLVPVENAELLKDLLQRLCNDQYLRNKLGNNGQNRAESVFGVDLFSKKISGLYKLPR